MTESPNHFGPFQPLVTKPQNINHTTDTTPQSSTFHPAATSRMGNGIILTAAIVFGVFMNSFMVYFLRKRSVLNKSTTTVLLHLGASDLIACFVVMPMQFVLLVSGIQPSPICSTAYYISTNFTVLVDCGCHVLLSVDRCCSVRQAQSIGIPVFYFKKVLAVIWGVAVGNAILTGVTNQGRNPWLFESGKSLDAGTIVLHIFIWFALAALVIALFCVHYTVKKQDQEAGENFGDSSSRKRRQKQIKVLKTTALAMTSAIILYLPLMLCEYVYRVFRLQSPSTTAFSQILVSVSHAINLVIYTGMSKKFRKAAWKNLKLHIRRDNIRSSLTDKRSARKRTDSKRQTFSSFIASNGEMDSFSAKGSEGRRDEEIINDVYSRDKRDKEVEFSDKVSNNSDDLSWRDKENTTLTTCTIDSENIRVESAS